MKLIVSFLDDFGESLSQLKRLNGSVIDPEALLKIEDSFILSFSSNIIWSCIFLFLFGMYGLHAFQDNLELQSTLGF